MALTREWYEQAGRFRNPMDVDSVRKRLSIDNDIYRLTVQAAGHQSAFTVDKLSWKLKAVLPDLIAKLAAEVEQENASQTEQRFSGRSSVAPLVKEQR